MHKTVVRLKGVNPALEKEAYTRVQQWFFSYPTREVSLSDLCELVGISKTTANSVVMNLKETGFLKIQPIGRIWRITCNQEHRYNLTRKIPTNLMTIYESGVLENIRQQYPTAKTIVLFGSYRRGDDTETSDIDIAVEIVGDQEPTQSHLGTIHQMGYRKNVQVNALVFSRNRIDLNLFVNIANGIVLEGLFEVRP